MNTPRYFQSLEPVSFCNTTYHAGAVFEEYFPKEGESRANGAILLKHHHLEEGKSPWFYIDGMRNREIPAPTDFQI